MMKLLSEITKGEALPQDFMKFMSISIIGLVSNIAVALGRISKNVNVYREILVDMAIRLKLFLGMDMRL